MKNSIKTSSSSRLQLLAILLPSLIITVQAQTTCSSTADCEARVEYCSNGSCALIGSCQKEVDCFNQENSFDQDSCIGYLECKDNQCSKTCSDSFCKPASHVGDLLCPTVMCNTKDCEGAVSCANRNCYNCDVFYFDAKGSQICNEQSMLRKTCSSNTDCHEADDIMTIMALGDEPYCAAGTCASPGTCTTDLDCVNPSNNYDIIECLGPIVCQQGQCTRDCDTGSLCENGANRVQCLADPCSVSGCAESTGCVADYCNGGCDALHFDAAGNVLAECNDPPFEIPESCTNDKECNDGQGFPTHFCSSGKCKKMGTCDGISDCLNPSNEIGFATCTGYHQCTSEGQCEQVCSNDEHCCFILKDCTAEDKEACPDAVTCVKDNCNDSGDHCGAGTGSFYFDSSGNSICGKVKSSTPTTAPTAKARPRVALSDTDLPDGAKMIGITLSMITLMIVTISTLIL